MDPELTCASSDRKGFVGELEAGDCGQVISFWLSTPANFTLTSHIVAVCFMHTPAHFVSNNFTCLLFCEFKTLLLVLIEAMQWIG